jgi:hypothetical protein
MDFDGANVLSALSVDDGTEKQRVLDGVWFRQSARFEHRRRHNKGGTAESNEAIGFIADVKAGKFD